MIALCLDKCFKFSIRLQERKRQRCIQNYFLNNFLFCQCVVDSRNKMACICPEIIFLCGIIKELCRKAYLWILCPPFGEPVKDRSMKPSASVGYSLCNTYSMVTQVIVALCVYAPLIFTYWMIFVASIPTLWKLFQLQLIAKRFIFKCRFFFRFIALIWLPQIIIENCVYQSHETIVRISACNM